MQMVMMTGACAQKCSLTLCISNVGVCFNTSNYYIINSGRYVLQGIILWDLHSLYAAINAGKCSSNFVKQTKS